ncbi:MAG: HAMP domain-containing sensor histidine kinase [Vulcanimicrobiota bacterium]
MEDIDSLREREKELYCLYRIQQCTMNSSQQPLERVLQEVVEALPAGWQRPEHTGACIEYFKDSYRSTNFQPLAPYLVEPITLGGQQVGRVVVSTSGLGLEVGPEEVFLAEEQQLLKSVTNLLSNFLEWRHLEVLGQRLSTAPERASLDNVERMVKRTLLGLSHELRNPLTVITTDLDLLRGDLPAAVKDEVITEIQGAVSRISSLVADLMLFLRAESGVDRPELEVVDLCDYVRTVVSWFRSESDTQVVMESDLSQDLQVELNKKTTARILHDLLRNGVLYSKSEVVKVSVYPSGPHSAVVCVRDDGCGIAQLHQERIFEQFYRPDPGRDRFSGGSGLGLPLARALAKSQNSELRLVSELGKGTEAQLIFDRWEFE